ncbi:MAG: CocE/NonD family hydrolase [Hyphomicrobiaceae bacterium]
MSVRTSMPFEVVTEDPVFVALGDGTRIAATVWRPLTAARVPVVLEMIPYRRRDGTVARDLEIHPYLAGHGIASIRIDLRGAGDSDGVLADEYTVQEQADAVELIAWAAALAFSNGRVGMTGISWGGFNSLQVAARRPPALGAIITLCASDDRYSDDIHYMGGALLTEQEIWSNFMLALQALPPDPQIVGRAWREMWQRRLAANRSLSEVWLNHQRRDDYWRQGSVIEDYRRITCPVMAVCGWEDSYSNFVGRLLEGLSVPRLGILGPWTHTYPCRGSPGPNIGYLQEALRWWRHWLADEPTGIMDEPMLRAFIGDDPRPQPFYTTHAGHWVAEAVWPSPCIAPQVLHLNGRAGLGTAPATDGDAVGVRSPATAGTDCGRWGGYGGTSPDLPIDQRREDGQGLAFDTPPLGEDMVLLGAPELDLEVIVDQPKVNLTARLCDVHPDGTSALITYGVLNLCHRHGHDRPADCPIGTPLRVKLRLNDIGRRIRAGHRLRLSLATQHWPIVWPQPGLALLTIAPGTGTLTLPVRPASMQDAAVTFEPAETATPAPIRELEPGLSRRTVTDDVGSGLRTITLIADDGAELIEDRGIRASSKAVEVFEIAADDPLSARLVASYERAVASGEADVAVTTRTELTADATHFRLDWRLTVRDAGAVVHEVGDVVLIPRDFC